MSEVWAAAIMCSLVAMLLISIVGDADSNDLRKLISQLRQDAESRLTALEKKGEGK